MALTAKLIELAAVALVMLFSTLRTMELISIYTSGRELTLLLLHVVCLIAAFFRPGHKRVLCLSIIYGTARLRMDVQMFWTPPTGTTLTNQVIVIAGASSGIGLAFAQEVASLNATVLLGCRDMDKCARVKPSGEHVSCHELDLADLNSVVSFANSVRAATSRIDALVLNAGLLTDHGQRTAQGLEASFGVIHLGHHLLTRELWPLLQTPHPAMLPARVISHASAAFMTAGHTLSSLLTGDGESDLRGEVITGCVRFSEALSLRFVRAAAYGLAHLYTDGYVALPKGEPALCPIAGAYSRAKLAQILFSQELQAKTDRGFGGDGGGGGEGAYVRRVISVAAHPGTVRSGIVWLPDWLVRPTRMGARVLLYCLVSPRLPGGSFVDEMQGAHQLLGGGGQQGKPPGYLYSVPIAAYEKVTEGRAQEYRAKLWEVSERLVQPFASKREWLGA